MLSRRLFHNFGPAKANDHSPTLTRHKWRTVNWLKNDNWSRLHETAWTNNDGRCVVDERTALNDDKPGWWVSVIHWEQRRAGPWASAGTAAENWVWRERSNTAQQRGPSSAACVVHSEDCSDLQAIHPKKVSK